jgi:predicted DNA-binding transcriptional regulator YafY
MRHRVGVGVTIEGVGQKSRTETVAAVMVAFLRRKLWSQAELARAADIRPPALHKLLVELAASGMPLTSKKEHPHVYWSLPASWYPGGVLFEKEDVADLLRQLRRLPKSKARDRLLGVVTQQLPVHVAPTPAPVVARPTNEPEELYVSVVEDAAARRVSLGMRYLTPGKQPSHRHVSVHLIDVGPPVRFIATCHRNAALRCFRVDNILSGRLDPNEPFRECPRTVVEEYRAASLDGFKGDGPPITCSFFVRQPESHWVANNLLEGMRAESLRDGIRVHVETSALVRLARFVVGLGAAAHPENAPLANAVGELARGALQQLEEQADGPEGEVVLARWSTGPVRPPSGL